MSSFFVPQLGSQIYAMSGMRTRLHLVASELGVYDGLNTQYNGHGFAGMHFDVHVVAPAELEGWFIQAKKSSKKLDEAEYNALLKPTMADKPKLFSGVENDLFNRVMTTYMVGTGPTHPREQTIHKE
jgi:cytochrome o ubiquinol oxidase subunit 2